MSRINKFITSCTVCHTTMATKGSKKRSRSPDGPKGMEKFVRTKYDNMDLVHERYPKLQTWALNMPGSDPGPFHKPGAENKLPKANQLLGKWISTIYPNSKIPFTNRSLLFSRILYTIEPAIKDHVVYTEDSRRLYTYEAIQSIKKSFAVMDRMWIIADKNEDNFNSLLVDVFDIHT